GRDRAEAALLTSAVRGDRLDLAQQSARIGVFDWDMKTGAVFWTEEEERIFGMAPGTFEGTIDAWAARTLPEDAARVRDEVDRAARDRRPTLDFGFRLRRATDGQLRWVEGSGRFVYDAAGAPARLVGLNIDVTDRRLAEERLRQGAERQRFLADATKLLTSSLKFEEVAQGLADIAVPTLGDCCFFDALGEDGCLRRVAWAHRNPDRREMFARIVDFVPPLADPAHPVSAAIRTGRRQFVPDVSAEWLGRAAGGGRAHLAFLTALGMHSLITVPLQAGEQVLGAMTFALTDTPRHHTPDDLELAEELGSRAAIAVRNARLFEAEQRARAQAEASAAEAESANRAKDQFLATLSHELRTPLNAIVGWVQLLRMGVLDGGEAKDALAKIQAGADAQKQLIEDILDVSRIIHGKLKVDRRRMDLAHTVSAAIDAVRPAAAGKGVTLAYEPAGRPFPIDGDPQRLQQVVWNLLNNAVKFTPARGQVRVSVEPAGHGRVRVVVADTGKGISPDFLPHVFERFRQADGSTTRRYAGLGIGLAIARHVTELHGGSVAADSAGDGRGAAFTVTLPLA
ncbi:MAG TPA: ATP-binding protein, partial [Humisphaera sp.]